MVFSLLRFGQQGTPTAHTPAEVWQAPRVVSRLVAGSMSCCRWGGLRFSTKWTRLTWATGWSPTGWWSCIELQPVACSWRTDLHWIATRTCLGSSSAARVGRRISVLTRGSVGGSAFPSTPMVLKVIALRVVMALIRRRVAVVGDGDSSLVRGSGLRGVCRPSNAHEDGRPVALKTDLAYRNGPAS